MFQTLASTGRYSNYQESGETGNSYQRTVELVMSFENGEYSPGYKADHCAAEVMLLRS